MQARSAINNFQTFQCSFCQSFVPQLSKDIHDEKCWSKIEKEKTISDSKFTKMSQCSFCQSHVPLVSKDIHEEKCQEKIQKEKGFDNQQSLIFQQAQNLQRIFTNNQDQRQQIRFQQNAQQNSNIQVQSQIANIPKSIQFPTSVTNQSLENLTNRSQQGVQQVFNYFPQPLQIQFQQNQQQTGQFSSQISFRQSFQIPINNQNQITNSSILQFRQQRAINNQMRIQIRQFVQNPFQTIIPQNIIQSAAQEADKSDQDSDDKDYFIDQEGLIDFDLNKIYTDEDIDKMSDEQVYQYFIHKQINENHQESDQQQLQIATEAELKCTICYDLLQEDENSQTLNCSHKFHKNCLSQWTARKSVCPICLAEI